MTGRTPYSCPSGSDHLVQIGGDLLKLCAVSPLILRADLASDRQTPLRGIKRGLHVNRVIVRIRAEHLLIILHRQQRRGKEDGRPPLVDTLLQILRRVDARTGAVKSPLSR